MGINFLEKTFSSLKHENFRLFFTGQTVSLIGSWIQITAMSWLVYDMTGSRFLLGLIGALSALPMLFLSVLGGVFADRYPKKEILIITQLSSMVFAIILAFLIITGIIQIWHIVVLATLSGIAFAIDFPVRQSFYIDIVGKKDLMNAIALNSSMVNVARIIGPAVAGIIMAKYGIAWCFIINCFTYFAVIFALLKIKVPVIEIKKAAESVVSLIKGGFHYVRNNRLIFDLMILMLIVGIFGWSYGILFPVIAKDIFHMGEKAYAALVSANGAGALIGALYIAYLGDSPKKRELVNSGIYLFGISMILVALSKIYILSLIFIALAGIGLVISLNATTTLIQSSVNDEMRGRVMGIWSLIFGGTAPLGNLFVGTTAEYTSVPITLIICALACIVATIVLAVFIQPGELAQELQEESIKV